MVVRRFFETHLLSKLSRLQHVVFLQPVSAARKRLQQLYERFQRSRVHSDWHSDVLEGFARILRPNVYVELGVYQCTTFNRVQRYCSTSFAVDIDISAERFVKGNNSKFVHGDSDEASYLIQGLGLQVDFLFIDGDHRSDAVRRDLTNFMPLMTQDGLIFLHDTWPESERFSSDGYCSDSFRVPVEINQGALGDWTCVSIPVHPGLTICTRSRQLPSWLS